MTFLNTELALQASDLICATIVCRQAYLKVCACGVSDAVNARKPRTLSIRDVESVQLSLLQLVNARKPRSLGIR